MILEYEIMKYDGDLGRPNLFVPLTQDVCQDKIGSLLEVFPSQASVNGSTRRPSGRCSLARHRVQCAFPTRRSLLRAQDPRIAPERLEQPLTRAGGCFPRRGTTDCRPLEGVMSPLRARRGKASLASCQTARAFGQEEHYEQHGVLRLLRLRMACAVSICTTVSCLYFRRAGAS